MDQGIADEDLRNPSSPASLVEAGLYGKDVRAWAPFTSYALGQAVVNPSGDLVTAVAAHTSGASYTSGNWALAPLLAANAFINAAQTYGVIADGATDTTTQLQAAINAASAAGGGTVLLPAGVMVAHGLVPKSGVTLLGQGRNLTKLRTTTAATALFVSGAATTGCVFQGLSLQSVGGGAVFTGTIYQSVFRDCAFYQNVDGYCIFDVTGWIDNLIQNGDFTHTLTATVPTFRAISATADVASFTIESCRFTNTGNYAIWLEGTSGAFVHNPTLRAITFEIPVGGAVKLLSCKNARIDTCGVHDLSAVTTRDLFVIDKSTSGGGVASESTTITGVTRDSSATGLGAGLYDINVISASDTIIMGADRYPAGTFAINLNSQDALVIGGKAALTNAALATRVFPYSMRAGTGSTGARPGASSQGVGASFYDLTLTKPIWSDGTNWRDGAGTIV
jgi:hypothetical protein